MACRLVEQSLYSSQKWWKVLEICEYNGCYLDMSDKNGMRHKDRDRGRFTEAIKMSEGPLQLKPSEERLCG